MGEAIEPKCSLDANTQHQEDPSSCEQDNQNPEVTTSISSEYRNAPRCHISSASTNTLLTFHPKCAKNPPLTIKSSNEINISSEIVSKVVSPMPRNQVSIISCNTQPLSLFEQAMAKLNDIPLNVTINNLRKLQSFSNLSKIIHLGLKSGDDTPPNSIENAPPSYSFVLRQMAARNRPRFMGTFIPSPSFVQKAPPPTYATAFDIYIDPGPPPPRRIYTFGFTPMPVICTECGYGGITLIRSKVTVCTHLCALILCLLCCWVCAPLPYFLTSCKEVYHYCRNCRHYLGVYRPNNPERSRSTISGLRRQGQR